MISLCVYTMLFLKVEGRLFYYVTQAQSFVSVLGKNFWLIPVKTEV